MVVAQFGKEAIPTRDDSWQAAGHYAFGCARGGLFQRTQGWVSLSYGAAGERGSKGGPPAPVVEGELDFVIVMSKMWL